MICDSVQKSLRPFTEDLLSESDYQGVRTHLEGCATCRNLVSSMGTMSYQLKELGDIRIPEDLSDTILYQFKKATSQPRVAAAPESMIAPPISMPGIQIPNYYWLLLAALFLISVYMGWRTYGPGRSQVPASTPAAEDMAPQASVWSNHAHYHIPKESRGELDSLFAIHNLKPERQSGNLIMVRVPFAQFVDFADGIHRLSGQVLDFHDSQDPERSGEPVQVSIYLKG